MSGGLEKFEASESWRKNFKKFLFVERKPAVKTIVTVSDTQRYSLDIGKDLQDLLKERKKQTEIGNPSTEEENKNGMSYSAPNVDDTFYERVKHDLDVLEKVSDESFEVLERMCEKTASDPNSSLFRYLQGDEGGTQKHAESPWRKTSDESFEALERMCDKTASDPNSTLFQYLHSDHRDQVLADAKKRSTDGSGGNCPDMDFGSRDPLLGKFSDCTLLDEVEAPSRMWENTIAVDGGFRTSPVKMVGLMRPSTIIEEAADESANSDISSQASFQTATTKGSSSDVSSAYDTAHDSTATTAHTNSSRQHHEELEIDVDKMLMLAIDKTRKKFPSLHLSHISPEAHDADINTASEMQNKPEEVDTSIDFIDLETTIGPTQNSSHSSVLGGDTIVDVVVIDDDQIDVNEIEETDREEEDISVIDILSDEEEDRVDEYNDIKVEQESQDSNNVTDNEQCEENKENYSFEPSSSERSMKFNDTMEEVEYLLKKGMEYMAARETAVETKPNSNNEQPVSEVAVTQPISPILPKQKETLAVPSASKVKLPSSSTFIKTPNKNIVPPANRFDVRPFPKLDIFGRSPQTTLGNPRHKELANKQFAHIVSPIGTYMKKTASTPLMSTCKMKNKNANALNSLASRELEYESRLCQPKIGTNSSDLLAAIPGFNGSPNILPKKAYISSELKHIVDERTPVTIPGGKKIQKYLENAMMPAVLRHDGKMKIGGGLNAIPASTKTPLKMANSTSGARTASTATSYRNNASLADLSVMSGDVSMYTIMDAQKF